MDKKIYQKIYDEISKYAIPGISKLVIYLEYGENSYSFSFYEKKDEKYIKCYDLNGVSENDIAETFDRIDAFVSKERSKETEPWTNMTMIVDADGHMHTDFDYTDLSGGTYQYKKDWKARYLI